MAYDLNRGHIGDIFFPHQLGQISGFLRNVFVALFFMMPFEFVCNIYAVCGRIVVQILIAAAIAHSIGGPTGYIFRKFVR